MAVNLFKISGLSTANGKDFWYRSDGALYTSESGAETVTAVNVGVTIASDLNADGTRTVTLGKTAFDTVTAGALSSANITIEDLNQYDRQDFRLAFTTDNNYKLDNASIYGGNQSFTVAAGGNNQGVAITISNITDGLLVSSDGKSLSWAVAGSSTATVNIQGGG